MTIMMHVVVHPMHAMHRDAPDDLTLFIGHEGKVL